MKAPVTKPGMIVVVAFFLLVAAIAGGYFMANSNLPATTKTDASKIAHSSQSVAVSSTKASPAAGSSSASMPAKWQPPEGDPLERYRAGKTAQERHDMISNFMALGHDRNAKMLIEALSDSDPSVQIFALESSTALEATLAHQVLTQGCVSKTADVREMAWSLLAPYGIDEKAQTFAQVLIQGPDAAFEEAFNEMSISPERPLFETMLNATQHAEPKRHTRLMSEMQEWLERAGEVPKFKSPQELTAWWAKNQQHYDQYLLRLD
jgi:hypothetical protein